MGNPAPTYKNKMANVHNMYQRMDKYKRVLCVCSAGLLRSPTAAVVLSAEPFGFNTRACGTSEEFALVCLDDALIEWADEIVCFSIGQHDLIQARNPKGKPVVNLDIKDNYEYRDEALVSMISEKYMKYLGA